jgi:hypothetical protein
MYRINQAANRITKLKAVSFTELGFSERASHHPEGIRWIR